jgi:hypothetical protein
MKYLIASAALACALATHGAFAADDSGGGATRFQLSATASSGMSDLKDKLESQNPGLSVSSVWPIGLSFAVTHDFSTDFAAGFTFGPIIVGRGDVSFTIVPVGIDGRFVVGHTDGMNTYIRAGIEKAIANGDFVSSSSVGGVIGIGFDFSPPRRNGLNVELTLHSTPVDVRGTSGQPDVRARPYKGTISVGYIF